jgi:hypothetical protein
MCGDHGQQWELSNFPFEFSKDFILALYITQRQNERGLQTLCKSLKWKREDVLACTEIWE